MRKEEIIIQLKNNYEAFAGFIASMDEADFLYSAQDKWTPGQHAEHIFRSVKSLQLAYSLPKILLRLIFGKANRPSRTYEALVEKYKNQLAAGGKASGRFVPRYTRFEKKGKIASDIVAVIKSINRKLSGFSEDDLDKYILPHPLLGKLTLREMLYFTIHHAEHHLNGIKHLLSLKRASV